MTFSIHPPIFWTKMQTLELSLFSNCCWPLRSSSINRTKNRFRGKLFNYQDEMFITTAFSNYSTFCVNESNQIIYFFKQLTFLRIDRISRLPTSHVILCHFENQFYEFLSNRLGTPPSYNNADCTDTGNRTSKKHQRIS